MAAAQNIAVIDIGKTNAKATLYAGGDGAELSHRSIATQVREDGPYPHFDVPLLWGFVCDALIELNREQPVDRIVVATHGASGAFIGRNPDDESPALPVLDYEFSGPNELAAEYDAVRPAFRESLSPRLPVGLNLGAQIFWQQRRFPKEAAAATAYLTYPQYWAWRLSGVAATEMSSIGCHTDLWNLGGHRWSSLVERMGWTGTFAPLRPASENLGPIRPALTKWLGLRRGVQVLCGIHDSSAALLPHVIGRSPPFTVVSTGTWTIVMAVGGNLDRLDPKRDTLAYLTPFGDAVPAARFMGGREFEHLAGKKAAEPSDAETKRVIDERVMALPTFAPGVGPFPDREGRWTQDASKLTPGERAAAASVYIALMTAEAMSCAGAGGPAIVEGPFAANRTFCSALAAITGRLVQPSSGTGGTSRGAALLADPRRTPLAAHDRPAEPLAHPAFPAYIAAWRSLADT